MYLLEGGFLMSFFDILLFISFTKSASLQVRACDDDLSARFHEIITLLRALSIMLLDDLILGANLMCHATTHLL